MSELTKGAVLLVDDDRFVLESLSVLLSGNNFQVTSCSNSRDAFERFNQGGIDVVLSDINMPGESGVRLLERIHAVDRETPVILMTAYADLNVAVAAVKNGAFDFIIKPYEMEHLLLTLSKGVNFRRLSLLEKNYRAELERTVEEKTREIQEAYQQMAQGEKMATIGQLAAGVAHEINNPIGFIGSNLGALAKYVERITSFMGMQGEIIAAHCPQEVQEALAEKRRAGKLDYITRDIRQLIAESLEGTERVRTIIQSLKSFSRKGEEEQVAADINAGIESTINIVWNEIKYVATLNRDLGQIPRTRCYPQQLNQVFMNLLVNAAHAIDKQGEISVRTWHDDGSIWVSISDSGSGIAEENRKKIFEPFFTTKAAGKGTGLGLSISAEIIRRHNGTISVQSELGKGTCFTIRIPVVSVE